MAYLEPGKFYGYRKRDCIIPFGVKKKGYLLNKNSNLIFDFKQDRISAVYLGIKAYLLNSLHPDIKDVITVEILQNKGWEGITSIPKVAPPGILLITLPPLNKTNEFKIRIRFKGKKECKARRIKIKEVFLIEKGKLVNLHFKTYRLFKALHGTLGDVTALLAEEDHNYSIIKKGEDITIEFTPQKNIDEEYRYVLECRGYYLPLL